jgi:RNA-directed DNA polymerase
VLSHTSYACRLGRGQHAALRRARGWTQRDGWFLKLDVAKFYDTVDHDVLRSALARRFRERRLLALFDQLLASYATVPGKGIPIGALTSQYLGNFYLDPFDHWVNQAFRMHRYLRYMDDMLFFGSRDELCALRRDAAAVLEWLGLAVKCGGILNRCEVGVPFLGFVLYPNRTRVNRQGRKRLRRRTKEIERAWEEGAIGDIELQSRVASLFAHARFGDDVAWRRMATGFSRIWERQEPGPHSAGRLVGQHHEELPLGVSQQEQAG